MKSFEREIFPIWAAIFKRHENSELSERGVIHLADLAIYASQRRPDRVYFGENEKRKADVGEKYTRVMA